MAGCTFLDIFDINKSHGICKLQNTKWIILILALFTQGLLQGLTLVDEFCQEEASPWTPAEARTAHSSADIEGGPSTISRFVNVSNYGPSISTERHNPCPLLSNWQIIKARQDLWSCP